MASAQQKAEQDGSEFIEAEVHDQTVYNENCRKKDKTERVRLYCEEMEKRYCENVQATRQPDNEAESVLAFAVLQPKAQGSRAERIFSSSRPSENRFPGYSEVIINGTTCKVKTHLSSTKLKN